MLAWLLACSDPRDPADRPRPEPEPPPDDTATTDGTTDPVTTSTGDTATSTGDTGAPDPCLSVPRQVGSTTAVPGIPLTEEFAFDAAGNVINAVEYSGVFTTTHAGDQTLLSPGASWEFAGARVSPDGTYVAIADEGGGLILRVDLATGVRDDLVSIFNPNSIGWDRWGRLWIGASDAILRWDPAVGGVPTEIVSRRGADMDGVTFSPDYRFVYFNDDSGYEVGAIELDANGEVVDQTRYADLTSLAGSQLDGMTTDACGNLYVAVTNGKILRVWTDGNIQTLVPANGRYTTSLSFGSGIGGWERDRLYVMDRSDGMFELDLGVEGRPEPHLP